MSEFRAGLEELTKKMSMVMQLVSQLHEEEAKVSEVFRNCCSELKSEVEQKERRMRALQDALQKLPL